jgi:hypothetical protein
MFSVVKNYRRTRIEKLENREIKELISVAKNKKPETLVPIQVFGTQL